MAEEHNQKSHEYETTTPVPVSGDAEVKDRGLFDFLSKKEDHQKHDQEEVMAAEFEEKVQVSEVDYEAKIEEQKEKEGKPSLLEKLHRRDSSSSSSSDEEEGEDGEKKKKKKKGLKEKLKEKISGEENEEKKYEEDTTVLVEKVEEVHAPVYSEPPHHTPEPIYVEPVHVAEPPPVQPEEKKGFLEKIKEKLPGHKKAEEVPAASPPPAPTVVECPPPPVVETHHEEPKEKKGIFDKIKEKLPGYHSKTEEDKEKGSSD